MAAFGLLAGFFAAFSLDFAAQAATTERVVVNRYSGLAIEGFDPVAYFTESRPARGLPDFEAREAGAVWRFRNEGNRASFVAHPEIYGPQFGGYDPVDLGRGVTYAGSPRFWAIADQRLYLFGREENRDAFTANPARFLKDAHAALAGARAGTGAVGCERYGAVSKRRAFGSPQAMNSGTMKSFRPPPKSSAAPFESVILPPAAVTSACPAATSHSEVGDRRG